MKRSKCYISNNIHDTCFSDFQNIPNWVGATVIKLAQLRVPPRMRGRVMSLNTLLIMGVRPLGDFPAGALMALVGGPLTVVISALIVGCYSLYLLIGHPVIRTLKQ